MRNSFKSGVNEKNVTAMGYLEPLIKKMHANLKITKERTIDDKEELKSLKKEFSKTLNELIKKGKIHNIMIPNIGYIYNQKWSEETLVSTIFTVYKTLESFYHTASDTQVSPIIQEKKQEILGILDEEREINVPVPSTEKKKTSLREVLADTLGISSLSEDTFMEVLQKFNYKHYSLEQLVNMQSELKQLKKKYEYSMDEKGREFIVTLSKRIKDGLELSQEQLKEQTRKRSKEQTDLIYFQNFPCIDSFIVRAHEKISQQSYASYTTLDELKKNTEEYEKFITFRKEFSERYESTIYKSYESLFKNNPTIDGFFYNAILGDLRRIGDNFSSRVGDFQIFLGIKRGFILGDLYEFLGKQIKEIHAHKVKMSPLLAKELSHYASKKPVNVDTIY